MKVTFYIGKYTRPAGQRQKGIGVKTASDDVERVRIEDFDGSGSVIDRPVREADKLHHEIEYGIFKDPQFLEKRAAAAEKGRADGAPKSEPKKPTVKKLLGKE